MLMIRPPPRASMCGITARLIRNVPLRLTSMTRSQASSGTSHRRRRSAPWGAAALLTSTSMRPNRASASATKRSASAARLTSPTTVRTRRPMASISPARLSSPFHPRRISSSPSSFSFRVPPGATSVATTSAPARANATEIARPIPRARPQPVTSTILPSNSLTGRTSCAAFYRTATDEQLRQIYDIMKQGPMSANTCPARILFLRTPEAKARLLPALASGNVDKTKAAPVTAIIGYDTRFFELMPPKLFAHRLEMADNDAKNPVVSQFETVATQSPPIHRAGGALGNPIGLSGPPPACRLPVRLSRRTTTGFPRPHPPRPPSPRCSRSDRRLEGRGARARPEAIACPQPSYDRLECGRDRRYSTRVLRCPTPRPERRGEGGRDGWALGNPSSYVVTGVPLTDMQADG